MRKAKSWHSPILLFCLLLGVVRLAGIKEKTAVFAQTATERVDEAGHANIVLILDTSGSMAENDPAALRVSAAKLFVDLASAGDRIGIVQMAGPANTRALTPELVPVTDFQSRETLKTILERTRENQGDTYMGDALNLAYNLLDAAPANNQQFVLLLTDGRPEPESQRAVVTSAVARFRQKENLPIFAIALGNKAEPAFLEQTVTTPTNGRIFSTNRAEELVDLYLQLYAYLLDDRYIEQILIPPGQPVEIASLTAAHRLTQLSFIVHQVDSEPQVVSLQPPTGRDLTLLNSASIYRGQDPAYQVYTIFAGGDVPIAGEWTVTLAGNNAPTPVTMMARSDLRLRWLLPKPMDFLTEQALRFVPAYRPFYLQLGALEANGSWALGLAPGVEANMGSNFWQVLRDDGLMWDFFAADGRYTAVYDTAFLPGTHTLRVELPTYSNRPLHLYKTYLVEALPLPVLQIRFLDDSANFGIGQTIYGELLLAPVEDISIQSLDEIFIAVRDPQGQLWPLEPTLLAAPLATPTNPLAPTPTAPPTLTPRLTPNPFVPAIPTLAIPRFGGRDTPLAGPLFRFAYTPEQYDGVYTFFAVANFTAADANKRQISFTEVARADFGIAIPTFTLSTPTTEIRQAARHKAGVTVQITSNTWREEVLAISAISSGLKNFTIFPSQITIPAHQTRATYTIDVFSDNEPGTEGLFTLHFSSPEGSSAINGNDISWRLLVSSGLTIASSQQETEIIPGKGGNITIQIFSDSPREEELTISWEATGLGNVSLLPQRILVPPGDQTAVTLKVFSDGKAGAEGEITLTFAAQDVTVTNNVHTWQAKIASPIQAATMLLCAAVLLALAFFAFLVVRRLRR